MYKDIFLKMKFPTGIAKYSFILFKSEGNTMFYADTFFFESKPSDEAHLFSYALTNFLSNLHKFKEKKLTVFWSFFLKFKFFIVVTRLTKTKLRMSMFLQVYVSKGFNI